MAVFARSDPFFGSSDLRAIPRGLRPWGAAGARAPSPVSVPGLEATGAEQGASARLRAQAEGAGTGWAEPGSGATTPTPGCFWPWGAPRTLPALAGSIGDVAHKRPGPRASCLCVCCLLVVQSQCPALPCSALPGLGFPIHLRNWRAKSGPLNEKKGFSEVRVLKKPGLPSTQPLEQSFQTNLKQPRPCLSNNCL